MLSTGQIRSLTTTQLQAFSTDQIKLLPAAQVQYLSTAQMEALRPDQVASLTTEQVGGLMWRQLNTTALRYLTREQIQALTNDQVQAIWNFNRLSVTQMQQLTPSQVASISPERILEFVGYGLRNAVVNLTPSQLGAYLSNHRLMVDPLVKYLNVLSPDQVAAIPPFQISSLYGGQIQMLNTSGFTAQQVADLIYWGKFVYVGVAGLQPKLFTDPSIRDYLASYALSPDRFSQGLVFSTAKHLSFEQLANIDVSYMSVNFLKHGIIEYVAPSGYYDAVMVKTVKAAEILTSEQVKGLSQQQISGLGADIWSLSSAGISSLSAVQISFLSGDQLNGALGSLTSKLNAIDASAFSRSQLLDLSRYNSGSALKYLNAASLTEDQLSWLDVNGRSIREDLTSDQLKAREAYQYAGLSKESDAQVQALDAKFLSTVDALNTVDASKHTVIGALTDAQLTRLAATAVNQLVQTAASDMLWMHQNAPTLSTGNLTVQSAITQYQTLKMAH